MLKPSHQRFAELAALGTDLVAAYREAFGAASDAACRKGATRMSQNVAINTEIQRIRTAAEKQPGSVILSLAEKRSMLARIARAPFGPLTKDAPYAHEILAMKERPDDDATPMLPGLEPQLKMMVIDRVKIGDAMRAIELDARLGGEFPEGKRDLQEASTMAEEIAAIRRERSGPKA